MAEEESKPLNPLSNGTVDGVGIVVVIVVVVVVVVVSNERGLVVVAAILDSYVSPC